MIFLSVNSYCLNQYPVEIALQRLGQLGYRNLELVALDAKTHLDLNEWDVPRLRSLLANTGLKLIALYPKVIDIWTPERLEASIQYIQHTIEVGLQLGSNRIVFPPLLPRQGFDYARLAEGLKRLVEYIGSRPVKICLENHHNWPLSYTEDYARLFDLIDDPRLGIALDTGHFTSSKVDHLAFIDQFAEKIFHIHIKDHIGTTSVPLGSGETPLPAIFERLRDIGYSGYASVEMEVEDPQNMERYLADALRYCQQTLGISN